MDLVLQKIADVRDLKARTAILFIFYFSLIFLASHFVADLAISVGPHPPKSLTTSEWQSFLYALWYCPFLIPFFLLPPKRAQKNSSRLEVYYLIIAIFTASLAYTFVTSFEPAMIKWVHHKTNPVQEWLQKREGASSHDAFEDEQDLSEMRALEQDPEATDKLIRAMQFGPDTQMLNKEKEEASHDYDIVLQVQEGDHSQSSSSPDPDETREQFINENTETFIYTYRSRAIEGLANLGDKKALDALKYFSIAGQPEQLRLFALSELQRLNLSFSSKSHASPP